MAAVDARSLQIARIPRQVGEIFPAERPLCATCGLAGVRLTESPLVCLSCFVVQAFVVKVGFLDPMCAQTFARFRECKCRRWYRNNCNREARGGTKGGLNSA